MSLPPLRILVHPGAELWAPTGRLELALRRRFRGADLHFWPRSEAVRVAGKDLGPYAFRAFTRGTTSHVFVDPTETPESAAWVAAHELAHAEMARRPDVRAVLKMGEPTDAKSHDDRFHELDPEELWADGIAARLFDGERLDRAWWRKRTPRFGAGPTAEQARLGSERIPLPSERPRLAPSGPSSWSPEHVLELRRQGISHIAHSVGRVPGEYVEPAGGISALHKRMLALGTTDDPELQKLLTAIAWQESHGDPLAVSSTGALGLMQLTQYLYSDTSPAINPFRPEEAASRALEVLEAHFDRAFGRLERRETTEDPVVRALMAYKEGWRGSFKNPERGGQYAERVLELAAGLP